MSLEAKIELLTEAVTRLIDALNSQTTIVAPSAPAPQPQPVKEATVVPAPFCAPIALYADIT